MVGNGLDRSVFSLRKFSKESPRHFVALPPLGKGAF